MEVRDYAESTEVKLAGSRALHEGRIEASKGGPCPSKTFAKSERGQASLWKGSNLGSKTVEGHFQSN
jgi:hypothetical protein